MSITAPPKDMINVGKVYIGSHEYYAFVQAPKQDQPLPNIHPLNRSAKKVRETIQEYLLLQQSANDQILLDPRLPNAVVRLAEDGLHVGTEENLYPSDENVSSPLQSRISLSSLTAPDLENGPQFQTPEKYLRSNGFLDPQNTKLSQIFDLVKGSISDLYHAYGLDASKPIEAIYLQCTKPAGSPLSPPLSERPQPLAMPAENPSQPPSKSVSVETPGQSNSQSEPATTTNGRRIESVLSVSEDIIPDLPEGNSSQPLESPSAFSKALQDTRNLQSLTTPETVVADKPIDRDDLESPDSTLELLPNEENIKAAHMKIKEKFEANFLEEATYHLYQNDKTFTANIFSDDFYFNWLDGAKHSWEILTRNFELDSSILTEEKSPIMGWFIGCFLVFKWLIQFPLTLGLMAIRAVLYALLWITVSIICIPLAILGGIIFMIVDFVDSYQKDSKKLATPEERDQVLGELGDEYADKWYDKWYEAHPEIEDPRGKASKSDNNAALSIPPKANTTKGTYAVLPAQKSVSQQNADVNSRENGQVIQASEKNEPKPISTWKPQNNEDEFVIDENRQATQASITPKATGKKHVSFDLTYNEAYSPRQNNDEENDSISQSATAVAKPTIAQLPSSLVTSSSSNAG